MHSPLSKKKNTMGLGKLVLAIQRMNPLVGFLVLGTFFYWLAQLTPFRGLSETFSCGSTAPASGYPKHRPDHTYPNWKMHGLPLERDGWCDRTAAPCERNSKSCTPCSGGPEGKCLGNGCVGGQTWNDSVTNDCTGPWAPHQPDGTTRIHKMPNYYGWGTGSDWYYGEPFYARSVKY
jgi:hypothetical protein